MNEAEATILVQARLIAKLHEQVLQLQQMVRDLQPQPEGASA
jgi:hypothetical protein